MTTRFQSACDLREFLAATLGEDHPATWAAMLVALEHAPAELNRQISAEVPAIQTALTPAQ